MNSNNNNNTNIHINNSDNNNNNNNIIKIKKPIIMSTKIEGNYTYMPLINRHVCGVFM